MNTVKVAFLFPKGRDDALRRAVAGEASDMPLYGTNHAASALSSQYACSHVELASSYHTMRRLRSFDVVFTSAGLPVFALQRVMFRKRPAWIFLAINIVTVLAHYPWYAPKRYLMVQALRRMDRIVCLSSAQRSYLIAQGVASERIEVITFGTDKTFFMPSSVDGGRILAVGRDTGRDYRTLLSAAERVDAPFLIVAARRNIEGEGITGLPHNVTVEYGRPWGEYRALLAEAHIVVVPLKKDDVPDASDCSGQTVALDALAAGKPLVLTKRPWTDDYVTHDVHAILVEPGDAPALERAIRLLLNDAELRERLGKAGRELVERKLNTVCMGEKVARIIESVSGSLRLRRGSVQSQD